MDYEHLVQSDVLFVTESVRWIRGKLSGESRAVTELLEEATFGTFQVSPAVKCPTVKEEDMTTDDRKICKQHLLDTIDKVKPKLIFACGNLAMKQLITKSGVFANRGSAFTLARDDGGYTCPVVPIYHPYGVLQEPMQKDLFLIDILNAWNIYVLNKKGNSNFEYSVLITREQITDFVERIDKTQVWSVDVETTGLDFLKDVITTISFTSDDETCVIPVKHRESPFKDGKELGFVIEQLNELLGYPNRKVFHNVKYDLKFLKHAGVEVTHAWCTKLMHHNFNENIPARLMDLVKIYFADELDRL